MLSDGTWRYYVGFGVGRLSGFVVLPVLSRVLGVDGFGELESTLAAVLAAGIVVDAGLGAALVRYVGDSRYDERALLLGAARLQALACGAGIVLFAPLVAIFAPAGPDRVAALSSLVLFALVEGLAVLGSGHCRATGRDGDFLVLSLVRLATTVVATLAGVALFGLGGALVGIALGGSGFAIYAARNIWEARDASAVGIQRALARYGFPLVATSAVTWSLAVSDRLFLQQTADSTVVGTYSANYRLGSLVLLFIATPIALTWVRAARQAMDEGRLRTTQRYWAGAFTGVALLAAAVLALTAPVVVPVFFGSEFASSRTIVALVALSGWLGGVYYFAATPFFVGDDTRGLIGVSATVVMLNFVLNALLIPAYEGEGAAVATLLSYLGLCVVTWGWAKARSAPEQETLSSAA